MVVGWLGLSENIDEAAVSVCVVVGEERGRDEK